MSSAVPYAKGSGANRTDTEPGLSIMADIPTERRAAAFAFSAFWASTERTTWWSLETGYKSVRVSAVKSPAMQEFFAANPTFRVAVDQLSEQAAPSDPARSFLASGQSVIDLALQEVAVNAKPTEQAFDEAAATLTTDAQSVIEEIIAREGDLVSGAPLPGSIGTPVPVRDPARPASADVAAAPRTRHDTPAGSLAPDPSGFV